MQNFFGTTSSIIAQKSLDALWLKQKVLANNLANIDTPGFKGQAVIFEDLLKQTLKHSSFQAESLSEKLMELHPKIVENNTTQLRPDGNNVDVDEQSLELAKAQIQYEYMTRSISEGIARMKYAITGGQG